MRMPAKFNLPGQRRREGKQKTKFFVLLSPILPVLFALLFPLLPLAASTEHANANSEFDDVPVSAQRQAQNMESSASERRPYRPSQGQQEDGAAQGINNDQKQHKVHIQYCTSWGMKRNFVQVKEFLAGNYPNSFGGPTGPYITGDNYPAPAYATALMGFVQAMQLVLLAVSLMGESVFNFVPFMSSANPPDWYKQAKENPMLVLAVVFFIAPTIANSFVTSGAFEIELDGVVVFSKIQTGRFPTGPELLDLMNKAGLLSGRTTATS